MEVEEDDDELDVELVAFLKRLESADLGVEIFCETDVHSSYGALWSEAGVHKTRHKLQESALIAHMEKTGMLWQATDFLEYGCGVATLSHHVALVRRQHQHEHEHDVEVKKKKLQALTFHMLDRASFRSRSRYDYRIRALPQCSTNRITTDVMQWNAKEFFFNLNKKKDGDEERKWLCFSKHFCGFASDIALNQFCNVLLPLNESSCLCLAPCCHALIVRELFLGDLVWLEVEMGLSLDMLKSVCGWATLDLSQHGDVPCKKTHLMRDKKKELGAKAKRVLDCARVRSVQKQLPNSHEIRLVQYTDQSVECNLMIIQQKQQ